MQKESANNYYKPAEDTLFFAEHLQHEKGRAALDIGTGSGFLAQCLSRNFELIVATDIDLNALAKAHESVENCICCNAADALTPVFDLVVCNLPYLPSEEMSDPAVDGLCDGVEGPIKIIGSASKVTKEKGKIIFLTSSLANHIELVQQVQKLGFVTKVIAKKKLFFEELILVECTRSTSAVANFSYANKDCA